MTKFILITTIIIVYFKILNVYDFFFIHERDFILVLFTGTFYRSNIKCSLNSTFYCILEFIDKKMCITCNKKINKRILIFNSNITIK